MPSKVLNATKFLFMREQPKDRNRLEHILEATETILSRTEEMTREGLTEDKVFFYAMA